MSESFEASGTTTGHGTVRSGSVPYLTPEDLAEYEAFKAVRASGFRHMKAQLATRRKTP